jgi:hypothetical protein
MSVKGGINTELLAELVTWAGHSAGEGAISRSPTGTQPISLAELDQILHINP